MLERPWRDCELQYACSSMTLEPVNSQSFVEHSNKDGNEGYKENTLRTHNQILEYTLSHNCDECRESFSTLDELSRHKQRNHQDQDVELENVDFIGMNENLKICKSTSWLRKNLQKEGIPTFNKELVGEPLSKQEDENKAKTKLQRNFTCQTCGKAFRGSKPLREHEVVHTGAREFACEICGKAFGTRANMKIHLATHSDKRPFACNVCNATFRQKDSLKVHLRKHNGERPFVCNVCNMTFDRTFTLKNHLLTHGEVRSYVCVVCGKAFTTRGGLNNHERLHYKDPAQKKKRKPPSKPGTGNWICDECGKMYSTRSNLKMHQRSHEANTVTHPCSVCGRVYKHKDSLEVHMRRHADVRPYTCPVCGRNFYRNSTLKLHILTHTGEKPHKCPVAGCDKAFTQRSTLYYHVQNHGKQAERAVKKSRKHGVSRNTDGASDTLVNIADSTILRTDHPHLNNAALPSLQTGDSLTNDRSLEVSPFFVADSHQRNSSEIINPGSVNLTDSIENDSLPISNVMGVINSSLSGETLSIKLAVEGIHSSVLTTVLNGHGESASSNAKTSMDSVMNRQVDSHIPSCDAHMTHVGQLTPVDHVTDTACVCQTDVTSNLVWESTVLPMTLNNISEHTPAINNLQQTEHVSDTLPVRSLSQSMDQSLYVISSGIENVPFLVSVDGHLYEHDHHDKNAGMQNGYVPLLH